MAKNDRTPIVRSHTTKPYSKQTHNPHISNVSQNRPPASAYSITSYNQSAFSSNAVLTMNVKTLNFYAQSALVGGYLTDEKSITNVTASTESIRQSELLMNTDFEEFRKTNSPRLLEKFKVSKEMIEAIGEKRVDLDKLLYLACHPRNWSKCNSQLVALKNLCGRYHNESLEHTGDSVLEYAIAKRLFKTEFLPNEIARMRTYLTCNNTLRDYGAMMGIDLEIINDGTMVTDDNVSDTVESILGALLYFGIENSCEIIHNLFDEYVFT